MVADEYANIKDEAEENIKPEQLYKMILRQTENYPYTDSNFLKKPFLEACEKASLFEFPMEE